ncbi:MAG TPA: CmcJ/NvfI family oxidoreductase, partial [Caulobacteraceae bacterium]|nr:CmcJ/NvfI family oxidoreductase [Caulobacteraceae bacterium]
MSVLEADILDSVRTVQGVINYVAPDSLINRRFVVPGNEHNTGRFEPHTVTIRDGRQVKARIGLDSHGFVLAERPSAVVDFDDKAEVDRLYPDEVAESVRALTGATRVAVMGWVLRTSGEIAEQGKR